MKTETIQQRIESTEKQIEKKQKSIQRYQAFIDKVNKQLLVKIVNSDGKTLENMVIYENAIKRIIYSR